MRKLLAVILFAAAVWSGWWFVGARSLEAGLTSWLDLRRAEGWQADYTTLKVRGFPNRFDTTITDVALADPDTGLAWSAPFFQLLALSYQPNHVIAVWPHEQSLATPWEKIALSNSKMQASMVLAPGPDLALDRATLAVDAYQASSERGWSLAIASGQLAARQAPALTDTYDIAVEATEMRPSGSILELARDLGLADVFQTFRLDAQVAFDRPWDRHAIEDSRPQPTKIDLDMLEAHWGDLHLQAAGQLGVDADGFPNGKLTLRAKNWRDMIGLAVGAGALSQSMGETLESALGVMAGLSGNRETLDVPLNLQGGRVSLGPVPIGPAPRLTIR